MTSAGRGRGAATTTGVSLPAKSTAMGAAPLSPSGVGPAGPAGPAALGMSAAYPGTAATPYGMPYSGAVVPGMMVRPLSEGHSQVPV